jgi:hypothetical protein
MEISLLGFGERVATFAAAEGVAAGVLVKISANGTVAPCTAGDVPCGLCVNVRGGFAAVQLGGYLRLPYTGTVALGRALIAANTSSSVKAVESPKDESTAAASGVPVLVTDIDESAEILGCIL